VCLGTRKRRNNLKDVQSEIKINQRRNKMGRFNPRTESGHVCPVCGVGVTYTEVIDNRSECCGGCPVLEEDHVDVYNLFYGIRVTESDALS